MGCSNVLNECVGSNSEAVQWRNLLYIEFQLTDLHSFASRMM